MTHTLAEEHEVPRWTRAVSWIVALNVAVYVLQVTIVTADGMQNALAFTWGKLPSQWWTIGTFLFVHGGFWHLALNAYTLYLFGPRLETSWSAGEFRNLYLLCGLGGWLFHVFFARELVLVGASAAVMGVMLAYAMRWPGEQMYLLGLVPMRANWLVGTLVGAHLFVGMTAGGQGSGLAYLAHLGGLAAAWVYLRSSAGSLERLRQRISPVPDVPDETPRAIPRSLPRSRERGREVDDIVAQSNAALSRRSVPPVVREPEPQAPRLTDLDRVLDKISERGIGSLTSDERRLLEERSRELRGRDEG